MSPGPLRLELMGGAVNFNEYVLRLPHSLAKAAGRHWRGAGCGGLERDPGRAHRRGRAYPGPPLSGLRLAWQACCQVAEPPPPRPPDAAVVADAD